MKVPDLESMIQQISIPTKKRYVVGSVWYGGSIMAPVYKWAVYDLEASRGKQYAVKATRGLFKTKKAALKRAAELEMKNG